MIDLVVLGLELALAASDPVATDVRTRPRVRYFRRAEKPRIPERTTIVPRPERTVVVPQDGYVLPEGSTFDDRWKVMVEQ